MLEDRTRERKREVEGSAEERDKTTRQARVEKGMKEEATRGPCLRDLTTCVLFEICSQHEFDTVDFSNDRGLSHLATDVVP